MTIDHSRYVGFSDFKNATLQEICDYFKLLSTVCDSFLEWAEAQYIRIQKMDGLWLKDDGLGFINKSKSQFTYYRDEVLRLANGISRQTEDRHILSLRALSAEVRDFDETCVRFKNHVVAKSHNEILHETYATVRDYNNLFPDISNAILRIELLRSEMPKSDR
jgi:hypothetical protein